MVQKLLTLFFLLSTTVAGAAWAQQRGCGTMQHLLHLEKQYPNLQARVQSQARAAATAAPKRKDPQALAVTAIPVVVHVVYYNAAQNISEAQIQSQLEVLNRDFRRLNADRDQTPDLFKGVAADSEVEFVLAQRTPQGEPTTGITRTQTTVNGFGINNDAMKFTGTGGQSAWDTRQYLNIWVVAIKDEEEVLGYSQFPNAGPAATDGVVIDYRAFGTTGTAAAPYHLGRTTTHEVGHWLNLLHIWGDAECGDDLVADTPTQKEANNKCPAFPHPSCNNTSDMFMNYMDYTYDACMNLFTQGQKNVMQYALATYRPSILTSLGAQPPVLSAFDAALHSITSPLALCSTTFTPALQLQNRGTQQLTSAVIQYQLDNQPAQTFSWTGSLASFERQEITLPQQTLTKGVHTLTLTLVSRNGSATDENSTNDQLTASVQVLGRNLPLSEGFEDPAFPPPGWIIFNPNDDLTWERTTAAAKTGSASAVMFNYYYDANGLVDELVLPPVDLTTRSAPKLSFQLAYSLLSPNGYSDTLEVWISTDCGTNYERLYSKAGQNLTTVRPYYTEDEFFPTSSQWRLETVDLADYAQYNTVFLKFRHITDFENNLFLDDVLVTGDPVTPETVRQAIVVWPNPSSGNISIASPQALIQQIEVWDTQGKKLSHLTVRQTLQGEAVRLPLTGVASGMYLVRIVTENGTEVRRVIVAGE